MLQVLHLELHSNLILINTFILIVNIYNCCLLQQLGQKNSYFKFFIIFSRIAIVLAVSSALKPSKAISIDDKTAF